MFKTQAQGTGLVQGKLMEKPQREFTRVREDERHAHTLRHLSLVTRRRGSAPARAAAAFLSCNRMSTQFVGMSSTERTILGNVLFQEVWASYMGTESPICRPWVGLRITVGRNKKRVIVIDKWGDCLVSLNLSEGHRTRRHDQFKWTLAAQCQWANYDVGVEAMNKFLPLIKQRKKFNKQKRRQRQGLVPDIIDVKRQCFMDIKTISFCKSRYGSARFRHGKRCDAVEFKADQVNTACIATAKKVDKKFNGVDYDKDGPGPVLQCLQSYGKVEGFVVGAHGECNQALQDFIQRIANQGALSRFREMGFKSPLDARSTVLSQIYLSLGIEAVRGVARIRVANLALALAGSKSRKAAAARRSAAKALFAEQSLAYWHRHRYFDD